MLLPAYTPAHELEDGYSCMVGTRDRRLCAIEAGKVGAIPRAQSSGIELKKIVRCKMEGQADRLGLNQCRPIFGKSDV